MQQRILPINKDRKGIIGPQVSYLGNGIHRFETVRGCPNLCPYCYEPKAREVFEIPEPLSEKAEILNMNILYHTDPVAHIKEIGRKFKIIEAVCGFDYRLMNQEIANAIFEAGFIKVRLAWDWHIGEQYKIKASFQMLIKAGYKAKDLSCFMVVNWKISKEECGYKLDLLKVWNIKVCDCCYDGGYDRAIPESWTKKEIDDFRNECKAHNMIINFGIYPKTMTGLKHIKRFLR